MCDTMVALGNSTKDGSVIFAKNSDRHPNECHIMIRIPRLKYKTCNEQVKTTYIKIPQVAETYEVLLLKPFWIWGCEMGCNEFGLNIGNEAVFTKEKYGRTGLLGMDLVRIALERCQESEEAVEMITSLLDTYGQGGNGGYGIPFTYHNSFLIADKKSAWVLETAGRYWAAKKVRDIYAISNCLSIDADFDKCHPGLIKNAVEKRQCFGKKIFSFRKRYGAKLMTHLSGAKKRIAITRSELEKKIGKITVETMKKILRIHDVKTEGQHFNKWSSKSVCMHAIGSNTTGSYIASLQKNICTYWVTGASTPCISIYKPVWLINGAPVFSEHDQEQAIDYWTLREKLHRMTLSGAIDLNWYLQERNKLEDKFKRITREIKIESTTDEKLSEISKEAFEDEAQFIKKAVEQSERLEKIPFSHGNWLHKLYWRRQNKKLNIKF